MGRTGPASQPQRLSSSVSNAFPVVKDKRYEFESGLFIEDSEDALLTSNLRQLRSLIGTPCVQFTSTIVLLWTFDQARHLNTTGGQLGKADPCERMKTHRNLVQVLDIKRRNLANAVSFILQDYSKVHNLEQQLSKFQDSFSSQPSNLPFSNFLERLCAFTHSFWGKALSRIKQQDRSPFLASATTTALSQLPSMAPSMWSYASGDEIKPESWRRDPSFDAFLDGRDLEASRQRKERPSWVAEPSDSMLLVAEEIADRAVEGWSGFIRPVDKIWEVSSCFGPRWGRQHNGVDLAAPTGEPVLAADSGEVTYAGWEPGGYGYLVEITHRDGWKTLYAHNSEIFTWEGQFVRRGDCIATVGETGRATGPHLHWEIRDHLNKPVDPSDHMKL